MRKIKFRYVYRNTDTEEIKIVIKDITQIEKDNEPYLDGWVLISRDEFTGLTDKNGKEIYDGDVVRVVIYSHSRKNEVVSDTLCPVSFKDGIFGVTHGNRSEFKSFSAFSYNVSFEIIGKIHDNPELLTK